MAIAHDVSEGKGLVARLLTTDFCPSANRFVYWLKEPVGWFVLATVVSVVVGLYVAPIGWTLAASLAFLIAVGMVWPAIAVRAVRCALAPDSQHVHEDEACELRVEIQNRWPLPIWGLAVEGFLDRKCESSDKADIPTVALAFVRAMATSTYRISLRPELRGRYPDEEVVLTCSFPFGIWTAKQKIKYVQPMTVWPKTYPIAGQSTTAGREASDFGEGQRSGRIGDFLGVREYRHSDCMRQVNWVATARYGDLIVTERRQPQCSGMLIIVDARNRHSTREQLDDQIRVAASLLENLHQSAVPLRLQVGKQYLQVRRGWEGFVQMMDLLADIPADGFNDSSPRLASLETVSIKISSNADGNVLTDISDPTVNQRSMNSDKQRVIYRNHGLANQLLSFWAEVRDANVVA